jgi:hypothetical protein
MDAIHFSGGARLKSLGWPQNITYSSLSIFLENKDFSTLHINFSVAKKQILSK